MPRVPVSLSQLDSGKFPSISQSDHDAAAIAWRFRGCESLREALLRVSDWAGPTSAAVSRFRRCGSRAVVQRSAATGRYRVVAEHCRNRWCPRCRTYASRRIRRSVLAFARGAANLKLLTLTLKPSSAPLRTQVANLWSAFRRLRQTRWWRNLAPRGVAVLETTRPGGERWHLHLHAVVSSRFLDSRELSRQWRLASRGSFIVDVRAVKRRGKAGNDESADSVAQYVAGYVAKPPDGVTPTDLDSLAEWLNALTNCHWITRFGPRPKSPPPEPPPAEPPDPGPWLTVASLAALVYAARNGHPVAQDVLRELETADEAPLPHDTT